MRYTTLGYGDEGTFPPCTGHPHDPRTPESEELAECPKCGSTEWEDYDAFGFRVCAVCGCPVD